MGGVGDFAVELDASVLGEKGVGGGLEEDVGAGVAEGEFLFGFDAEGVFGVFGFPPGAGEVEGVDQASVYAEGAFAGAGDGVFGDEGPVELAGALFEEVFEGGADVAFVVEACSAECGEGFVVGLDGGVVGFEIELGHRTSGYGEVMGLCGVDLMRCQGKHTSGPKGPWIVGSELSG